MNCLAAERRDKRKSMCELRRRLNEKMACLYLHKNKIARQSKLSRYKALFGEIKWPEAVP